MHQSPARGIGILRLECKSMWICSTALRCVGGNEAFLAEALVVLVFVTGRLVYVVYVVYAVIIRYEAIVNHAIRSD